MGCKHWMLLWAVAAIIMAGCGGADQGGRQADTPTENGAATSNKDNPSAQSDPSARGDDSPSAAVYAFLEAVRTGDDAKTAEMLTPLARQKTAEHNMVVAPPGSDTARFELEEAESLPGGCARVASRWIDVDQTGETRTDHMAWMLRKEEGGWRIAGVAASVFEGEPPLLLNFEDPEDMVRKRQMLAEEIRRRAENEQIQAKQPENSDGPVLR